MAVALLHHALPASSWRAGDEACFLAVRVGELLQLGLLK